MCACTHSAHVNEIAMNDKGMGGSVTEKRRQSRTSGKTSEMLQVDGLLATCRAIGELRPRTSM